MEPVPRILFQYGNIVLYTYTAFVALGVLAGTLSAWGAGHLVGRPFDELLDGSMWAFIGAACGARLWDVGTSFLVAGHWRWDMLVQGINAPAVHGVLVGGMGGLLLWSWRCRWSPWEALDTAAVGLAVGSAFVWGGLMLHGGAYGVPSATAWALSLPDLAGIVVPRAPVQAAGLVLNVLLGVLFAGLIWIRAPQGFDGWLFLAWAGVNGTFLLAAGFWRADPTLWIGPLRLDQAGALVQTVAVIGVVGWRLWRRITI